MPTRVVGRTRRRPRALVQRINTHLILSFLGQEHSDDLELVVVVLILVIVGETFGGRIGVLEHAGSVADVDYGGRNVARIRIGGGHGTSASPEGVGGRGHVLQRKQEQGCLHHDGQSKHEIHHYCSNL